MKIKTTQDPNSSRHLLSGFFCVAALVSILIVLAPGAYGADVTLAWDANSESDLAGYILYYGTSSGTYSESIDVGNQIQHTVADLQDGATYYFAVTAYNLDDYESDYSQELAYTVGAANNSPSTPAVPNSPTSGYVDTNYTFSTSASDPDGDAIEYRFDWGDGVISNWGASSQSHAWSSPGTYCIKAQVQDIHGATSGWSGCHNISITLNTHSITASAGANGSITPAGTRTVNDGADQSFAITANANYQVLDVRVDGTSIGAVTAYTFNNVTADHTISASFVSVNQAPVADAGSDQTVTEGATVTLNGSNSTDPGGSIAIYTWTQTDGLTVQLINAHSATANFTAPNVAIAGEMLAFRLTVTDGGGLSDSDTCVVEVTKAVVVDSDGDGVPDDRDDFPYDPNESLDTDGDGVGNNADTDDDNDGMPDAWELVYGLDPLKNDAGADPDGDQVTNINEYNLGTAPNNYEGNFKPETPELLAPDNYATVGLTPQLETGEFNDPNYNDVHSKTQWVITRAFDDVCVFDVTTAASLTSMIIPKQILEGDAEYIWKVRHFDNRDTASDWSAEREFITENDQYDMDKNGVPDIQEVSDTLDLDADGTMDNVQADIKCVQVENGKSQICVSIQNAENALAIVSLEAEDPNDPQLVSATQGKPKFFEFGLINFKVLVDNPGDETVVTVYLSKPAFDKGNCFKFDPIREVWIDYADYTDFSADRQEVYLILKDGGFGDADGIENGIIVDPLAFGSETDPNGSSSGSPLDELFDGLIPNDLSCFISVAAAGQTERQSWNLWREIRGRELAIIFVLMMLAWAVKMVISRIRQNRELL
jgi:chitinase